MNDNDSNKIDELFNQAISKMKAKEYEVAIKLIIEGVGNGI